MIITRSFLKLAYRLFFRKFKNMTHIYLLMLCKQDFINPREVPWNSPCGSPWFEWLSSPWFILETLTPTNRGLYLVGGGVLPFGILDNVRTIFFKFKGL